MHLAWRWFTGLGFDQEIPHHSTFSKNRHGRFQESKLFEELFEQIVRQCVEVGLVKGEDLSVDGSFVEANAAKQSRIPREQLAEAAQVHHTMRQYLVELDKQNPMEEPVQQQDQVSTTDPDSTYATKGDTPARLGVLRQLSGGQPQLRNRGSTSDGSAHEPGDSRRTRHAHPFRAMARTRTRIGSGRHHLRQWGVPAMVSGRSITPFMRTRDSIHRKRSPFSVPSVLLTNRKTIGSTCPAGSLLTTVAEAIVTTLGPISGRANGVGACSLRPQCTSAAFRCLVIHQNEPARQRARELVNTPEFAKAQRQRKKVEALFAELKESNRIASLAPAQTEVRAGAVLPGSRGPEHQAARAVPQPTDNTYDRTCLLALQRPIGPVSGQRKACAVCPKRQSANLFWGCRIQPRTNR